MLEHIKNVLIVLLWGIVAMPIAIFLAGLFVCIIILAIIIACIMGIVSIAKSVVNFTNN